MIPSLQALGKFLRRTPIAPTSVAALLERHEIVLAFRTIVRQIVPEAEAEIWQARDTGGSRENARVWAFLRRVETGFFPVYELDEYEQVVCGIPFVRNAWDDERFHALDVPLGELLLMALCAFPFDEDGLRIPVLDAAESLVPHDILRDIPERGFTPTELHERLDGTSWAAAADFADWVWGETGTVFLDVDDEIEIVDAEWTPDVVRDLVEQWQRAETILDRIGALTAWLEADPPTHFTRLLDAAFGRDPHAAYLHERRFYDFEITKNGLTPIDHDDARNVALPPGAADGDRCGGGPSPVAP